jgi:senataxin
VGTAFSKEGKSAHFDSVVARRILVCAPSNQAVDELAWKIHKGAIGPCGITGGFNLIRFGMLPGETRHDGRGKVNLEKPGDVGQSEKDRYLSEINLDNLVRNVARGKEVNVFAYNMDKATHDDNKRNSRFINYNLERQRILSQTHVVCCTLSGAGSKAFVDAVSRDEFPHSEFDAVIIDEACQGSEASCLIPLKFNPNAVVIVGDPKQLPVMAFARSAERCKSDRPLFERLHQNGWPINLLRIQYRMHESINAFPSKNFYEGNLITGDSVKKRRPAIWHHNKQEFFPPYLLVSSSHVFF